MIVGLGFKLSLVPFTCGRQTFTGARLRRFPTFTATASQIAIFGVVMRLFLYAPVGDSESGTRGAGHYRCLYHLVT